MTASADRVRRAIRAQRERSDVAALRDAVIRKAGLFMDLERGDCDGENAYDAMREMFDAIDALREATK